VFRHHVHRCYSNVCHTALASHRSSSVQLMQSVWSSAPIICPARSAPTRSSHHRSACPSVSLSSWSQHTQPRQLVQLLCVRRASSGPASTSGAAGGSTHRSCGIVGLPNVGKSTLFNAITRTQVCFECHALIMSLDIWLAIAGAARARADAMPPCGYGPQLAEAANYPFCTVEPNTAKVRSTSPACCALIITCKSLSCAVARVMILAALVLNISPVLCCPVPSYRLLQCRSQYQMTACGG